MYNLIGFLCRNDTADEVCYGHAACIFVRLFNLVADILHYAGYKLSELIHPGKSRVKLVAENGDGLLIDIAAVVVRLNHFRLVDNVLVNRSGKSRCRR